MRCLILIFRFAFGLSLVSAAQAQLVAPPSIDWVSLPSSATVSQTVNVGAGAHASYSDNSDGNDWNTPEMAVVLVIQIDLQRPGQSWTPLCGWLASPETPAQNWGSFTVNSPGTHYVRVRVMDGRPWYSDTYTYAIGVPTPAPAITSQLNLSVNQGFLVSYTITAAGDPTSFGASNLPAGLSIDTSSGVISGRVSPWTSTVNSTITATNSVGTDTKTLVWNITGAVITTGSSVSPATITLGSSVTLTRYGLANFGILWTEATMWKPDSTAEVLGRTQLGSQSYSPTVAGTYWFQVRIVDGSAYNYVDQWMSFAVTGMVAPTGLVSTSTWSNSAILSWNAATGATQYHVYRNGGYIGTTTGTSFNVTGLDPSTNYSFTVQGQDSGTTYSQQSGALNLTTAPSFIFFTPL